MKTLIFVSVAAVLALASPIASAASVDVPGFTLAETWTGNAGKLQLLSNDGGTARIAIAGFSDAILGDRFPHHHWSEAALAGTVQPGYRIDSLTFSGTLYGRTEVRHDAICEGCTLDFFQEGDAWNSARIWWSLTKDGATADLPATSAGDFQSDRPFSVSYDTSLSGKFELDLNVDLAVYAAGDYMVVTRPDGEWYEYYTYAYAQAGLKDVILTVQVSAVPEPATYAMLLAGLGVAGWAGRRRKSAA